MSPASKFFRIFVVAFAVLVPALVFADDIFHIRVGKNDKDYSSKEMQRRIWDLERAVSQLQQRVFQLEATPAPVEPPHRWTCMVSAFGKTYKNTAESRGEAEANVVTECSNASNEMHCRNVRCSE